MDSFVDGTGYLAACTAGLPTLGTLTAQRADLDAWSRAATTPTGYGALVEQGRELFAGIVGVDRARVATGSQTSAMVAVVAASLPDGAEVVVPDGDFSSVVFPFLAQAHRGVRVRSVPLADLADAVRPGTRLVAWSAVQSASGVVTDPAPVLAAARAVGALTLCDLTQAAGVLPVDAAPFDVTVTHAYKWLCAPRGVAFATFSDRALAELRPVQAGWYAGADVWSSCYGPDMRLADDARRFDVSPAWQAWPGAVAALRHLASVDAASAWRHATGLADRLADALGRPRPGQAITTFPDPDGTALRALADAGVTASGRAGRLRLAFHLWNDAEDVDRVVAVLGGLGSFRPVERPLVHSVR
ncbi:aminotransferase class V [Curtobacterium citreum]|uniref:Aminotransferase class V-fold PLP-dependent enzyme n=1 Tax=Curtobacterium citreum TaxID=2036 RepID=A0ABT2HJF5_9MICO|nr:aminotransferase class V-fold PLP-dependent enzyme [Curtobacterium citreum]MCS6523407.1 aminotransferase class V-fold PLP-dependent enzyme [Curtobacterium citreum]TQJ27739.1 selenocysteine lyase/cysteine desulfurase [Curtobacterium citreum]GGL83999.1 aminotransferase class V [Curtobacterium citreum]